MPSLTSCPSCGHIDGTPHSSECTQRVDELRAQLDDENPDALFADGLDSALIGIARRCGQPSLAAYSYQKAVRHFMGDDLNYEEAVEWMEINVVGAWMGPHTPVWIMD